MAMAMVMAMEMVTSGSGHFALTCVSALVLVVLCTLYFLLTGQDGFSTCHRAEIVVRSAPVDAGVFVLHYVEEEERTRGQKHPIARVVDFFAVFKPLDFGTGIAVCFAV